MEDCGKLAKVEPKPTGEAGVRGAGLLLDFLLINKGLFCLAEADRCWQEKKWEFMREIAANNPQFFPQGKGACRPIYF
jgi:hypothetical protein